MAYYGISFTLAVDDSKFPIHSSSSSSFPSQLYSLPYDPPIPLSCLVYFIINSITFLKTLFSLNPFLVPWLHPTPHKNTKTLNQKSDVNTTENMW